MRNFILMAGICVGLFSTATAQTIEEPVEYINFFSQEFERMYDLQLEYASFLAHTTDDQSSIKAKELDAATQKIHDKFSAVTAFEDDQNVKANAVHVLDEMLKISKTDYTDVAAEKAGCLDCFARVLEHNKLSEKGSKQLEKSMDALIKSIDDFAASNDVTMESDDDGKESLLGKINRINGYIGELDLAVLEVQYASTALIEALNDDPTTAKDMLKELSKAVSNASKRLKKVDRIKEDATAFGQAERLVEFHKDGIKGMYADMVNAYDKEGQIINAKVKAYNKASEQLNKGNNTWNNKYESAKFSLQQRNIPKPKQEYKRS